MEWEMKKLEKYGRPKAIGLRRMTRQEFVEHLAFLKANGHEIPEEAERLAMEGEDEEGRL